MQANDLGLNGALVLRPRDCEQLRVKGAQPIR